MKFTATGFRKQALQEQPELLELQVRPLAQGQPELQEPEQRCPHYTLLELAQG